MAEFKNIFARCSIGDLVTFNTSIALVAGNSYSNPYTVTGALTLTIAASPVAGSSYHTQIISNGTNVPTIAGALEHDSSSGYDNQAGAVNMLQIWHDGLNVLYAWSHFAWVTPVLLATAEILSNNRQTLVLTFSGNLATGSVPATTDFTITNTAGSDPVTNVDIDGSAIILTRTRSEDNATVTITYTKGINPIKSAASDLDVIEFTDFPVDYQTSSSLTAVRLPNMEGAVTETALGGGNYSYEVTSSNPGWNVCYARSSLALQADADGYFVYELMCEDINSGPIVGFTTSNSANYYNAMATASIVVTGLGSYKVKDGSGADLTPDVTTAAPEAGDLIKIERSGTNLIFSVSKNGGTSYTVFNTEGGMTNAAVYIMCQLGNITSGIQNIQVSGDWQ